jgi:stress-induced acidophilic repeat protein
MKKEDCKQLTNKQEKMLLEKVDKLGMVAVDNNDSDNKLGFASMPKEKREEIARKGGEQ